MSSTPPRPLWTFSFRGDHIQRQGGGLRSETVQLAERGYKLLWLPSPILSPRAVCVCVLKLGCPALAVGKASLRELCTNGGCWDVAKDTQSIMGASGTCSFKSCQDIGRLIVVCLSTRLPKHCFVLLHFLLFPPFSFSSSLSIVPSSFPPSLSPSPSAAF